MSNRPDKYRRSLRLDKILREAADEANKNELLRRVKKNKQQQNSRYFGDLMGDIRKKIIGKEGRLAAIVDSFGGYGLYLLLLAGTAIVSGTVVAVKYSPSAYESPQTLSKTEQAPHHHPPIKLNTKPIEKSPEKYKHHTEKEIPESVDNHPDLNLSKKKQEKHLFKKPSKEQREHQARIDALNMLHKWIEDFKKYEDFVLSAKDAADAMSKLKSFNDFISLPFIMSPDKLGNDTESNQIVDLMRFVIPNMMKGFIIKTVQQFPEAKVKVFLYNKYLSFLHGNYDLTENNDFLPMEFRNRDYLYWKREASKTVGDENSQYEATKIGFITAINQIKERVHSVDGKNLQYDRDSWNFLRWIQLSYKANSQDLSQNQRKDLIRILVDGLAALIKEVQNKRTREPDSEKEAVHLEKSYKELIHAAQGVFKYKLVLAIDPGELNQMKERCGLSPDLYPLD